MSLSDIFLHFPQPQCCAIFLKRQQRFLATMRLSGDEEETVYCANPGSMSGLLRSGSRALLWDSGNIKRKRRYTWKAVELDKIWIGTDTHMSNRVVEEIIKQKLIPALSSFNEILREHVIESGVRVDFLLRDEFNECLVEVKSASVVLDGIARYPDSKTPRGLKQLQALTRRLKDGQRVMVLFLVQRSDAKAFVVIDKFDPDYALAFKEALSAGLEVFGVSVTVSIEGFSSPKLLPYSTL